MISLSSDILAQSFTITDFRGLSGFTFVNLPRGGSDPFLELTDAGALRPTKGAIWSGARVPILGTWSSVITFQILDTGALDPSGNPGMPDPSGRAGADGLALVIQTESNEAIGYSGYGLGYHDIKGGIAIEVDTWDDTGEPTMWKDETEDPADHVAIHSNGIGWLSAIPRRSIMHPSVHLPFSISDGAVHTLAVRYSPGLLRVYMDDCTTPILEQRMFIEDWLEDSTAWIGITAATQSAWQHHRILSWCYTETGTGCGCPAPCDTVWLPSPPDTLRDTIRVIEYVDRWKHDTVEVPKWYPVYLRWPVYIDRIVYRDTGSHRVEYRDTGSIRIITRDSIIYRDTGSTRIQYRDTCIGPQLTRLDTICGGSTRSMELNLYRTSIVEVAPNPVDADVGITFDRGDRGPWMLELFTQTGERTGILAGGEDGDVGRYRATVDMGNVPGGQYLLRLRCGTGVDTEQIEVRR